VVGGRTCGATIVRFPRSPATLSSPAGIFPRLRIAASRDGGAAAAFAPLHRPTCGCRAEGEFPFGNDRGRVLGGRGREVILISISSTPSPVAVFASVAAFSTPAASGRAVLDSMHAPA
jgi:hypothetical protein